MMQNRFIAVTADYRLTITEYEHPDAKITAVILHGFQSSRSGTNAITVLDILPAVGMNGIALDFHAHGNSDGDFKDLTIAKSVDNVGSVIDFILTRVHGKKSS